MLLPPCSVLDVARTDHARRRQAGAGRIRAIIGTSSAATSSSRSPAWSSNLLIAISCTLVLVAVRPARPLGAGGAEPSLAFVQAMMVFGVRAQSAAARLQPDSDPAARRVARREVSAAARLAVQLSAQFGRYGIVDPRAAFCSFGRRSAQLLAASGDHVVSDAAPRRRRGPSVLPSALRWLHVTRDRT